MLALVVAACEKKDNIKNNNESESSIKDSYIYPLTGLETSGRPSDRAISVMINNHPDARPQSGLKEADIIYEVLVEGGMTRLLAVYHSEEPETVGPVRSARPYFIELANAHDSLYVFHGWSPEAKKLITNGSIDAINGLDYDGTLFRRVSFRKSPHNSYINFSQIKEFAADQGFMTKGAPDPYRFLPDDEEVIGKNQKEVIISYPAKSFDVRYEYDKSAEKYKRYSGGELTVERETETPVLLDNVLIVETEHYRLDEEGRMRVNLHSGGRAFLLQQGKLLRVEWMNDNGRIVPYLDGKEVPLVPGKSWVNIVRDIYDSVTLIDG